MIRAKEGRWSSLRTYPHFHLQSASAHSRWRLDLLMHQFVSFFMLSDRSEGNHKPAVQSDVHDDRWHSGTISICLHCTIDELHTVLETVAHSFIFMCLVHLFFFIIYFWWFINSVLFGFLVGGCKFKEEGKQTSKICEFCTNCRNNFCTEPVISVYLVFSGGGSLKGRGLCNDDL